MITKVRAKGQQDFQIAVGEEALFSTAVTTARSAFDSNTSVVVHPEYFVSLQL
jgi:hypothetical protein